MPVARTAAGIDLERALWGFPGVRRVSSTYKALQEVLLAYDGQMMLNGSLWNIKSKRQGAGIYSVWLESWQTP